MVTKGADRFPFCGPGPLAQLSGSQHTRLPALQFLTMRWSMPRLRNSLFGLLGHRLSPTDSMLEESLEDIREAMLDLLGDDDTPRHPQVMRRIRYATDVQALWYLRGDLLGVLAGRHGEAAARSQMETVTAMFRGLLPRSLHSRPSPLVG